MNSLCPLGNVVATSLRHNGLWHTLRMRNVCLAESMTYIAHAQSRPGHDVCRCHYVAARKKTAKSGHCACARMRDMRLVESWTESKLGPPQRQLQHRVRNKDISDFAPSDVEMSDIISGVLVDIVSTVFEGIPEEQAQKDPAECRGQDAAVLHSTANWEGLRCCSLELECIMHAMCGKMWWYLAVLG